MADSKLELNIFSQTYGSEGLDKLKGKLVELASATYLFEKGLEFAREGFDAFAGVIEIGENLEKLSQKTGVSAEALSGFQEAAKLAAVPVDTLERSLKKFTQNLGDVNNEKFTESMKRLGISTRDSEGQIRSTDAVLNELSDRFQGMQDGPRKAAIAVDLFGKAGSDLIPLLNMGSEEISRMGLKMGSEFPANAANLMDALQESNKLFKEQIIGLTQGLLPALTSVVTAWNEVSKNQKSAGLSFDSDTIKDFALGVYTAFKILADALDNIILQIRKAYEYIKGFFVGIKDAASSPFDMARQFSKSMDLANAKAQSLTDDFKKRAEQRTQDILSFDKGLQIQPEEHKVGTSVAPVQKDNRYEKESEEVLKFVAAQNGLLAQEDLKANAYKYTTSELQKMNIAQQINTQVAKESANMQTDAKAVLEDVAKVYIELRQRAIDLEEQNKHTWSVGAKQALNDYVERARDVASQTKELFTHAFQGMEDALVNFAKTGQLNFKKFADAVIDDMIRIAVRQASLGVLTTIGLTAASAPTSQAPAGGGSYLGTNTQLPSYSFSAPGSGKVGPQSLASGGASSSGINVNIAVNMQSGQESVQSSGSDTVGPALAQALKSAVVTELIQQKRPGGLLA